ncbi:MAG: NAD(P)/FAD-dependent oxidoreductase [Maricaulis sp.]|jgi:L-2-hydroxyglutarate oxidase LhgO|nr:NAD(P)/FAD-dependent oxidoreductase [Maricaulis sp.]
MSFDTDTIIVGAGAVGLATGFTLSKRGQEVIVLDREAAIGQGVSSRNSEVVHAGLYYPTGSLKARLCIEGRRALYAFMDDHKVDYRRCGKLVVATEPGEEDRLEAIRAQGLINNVEGMDMLSGAAARSLEPQLRANAALLVGCSGVMDSHAYMLALQGRIEEAGGNVVTTTPFERAEALSTGGYRVYVGGAEAMTLTCRQLIISASLDAPALAAKIDAYPTEQVPKIHYGKGVYFTMAGRAPFKHLVYPMPIAGALGTHYRRDLGDQARFGPDLDYVETLDYRIDPTRADSFYEAIRRFWPGLPDGALVPDYAGIRPKIHGYGEPQPDFRIDGHDQHGLEGLVTLYGIESPGLTASLAIGEYVAEHL